MKFLFAQYTAPQDSKSGYQWINYSPEIPQSYLELLFSKIRESGIFPNDGRDIKADEIRCGILYLPQENKIIAFRFLDGGQDGHGRLGKVTINCVVFHISDGRGKNIESLFRAPFMSDVSESGRDTVLNLELPNDSTIPQQKLTLIKEIDEDSLKDVFLICNQFEKLEVFLYWTMKNEKDSTSAQTGKQNQNFISAVQSSSMHKKISPEIRSYPPVVTETPLWFFSRLNWIIAMLIIITLVVLSFGGGFLYAKGRYNTPEEHEAYWRRRIQSEENSSTAQNKNQMQNNQKTSNKHNNEKTRSTSEKPK